GEEGLELGEEARDDGELRHAARLVHALLAQGREAERPAGGDVEEGDRVRVVAPREDGREILLQGGVRGRQRLGRAGRLVEPEAGVARGVASSPGRGGARERAVEPEPQPFEPADPGLLVAVHGIAAAGQEERRGREGEKDAHGLGRASLRRIIVSGGTPWSSARRYGDDQARRFSTNGRTWSSRGPSATKPSSMSKGPGKPRARTPGSRRRRSAAIARSSCRSSGLRIGRLKSTARGSIPPWGRSRLYSGSRAGNSISSVPSSRRRYASAACPSTAPPWPQLKATVVSFARPEVIPVVISTPDFSTFWVGRSRTDG